MKLDLKKTLIIVGVVLALVGVVVGIIVAIPSGNDGTTTTTTTTTTKKPGESTTTKPTTTKPKEDDPEPHEHVDATVIIGLKQNPTYRRRFSPIFLLYRAFCGAKHRMPL